MSSAPLRSYPAAAPLLLPLCHTAHAPPSPSPSVALKVSWPCDTPDRAVDEPDNAVDGSPRLMDGVGVDAKVFVGKDTVCVIVEEMVPAHIEEVNEFVDDLGNG